MRMSSIVCIHSTETGAFATGGTGVKGFTQAWCLRHTAMDYNLL